LIRWTILTAIQAGTNIAAASANRPSGGLVKMMNATCTTAYEPPTKNNIAVPRSGGVVIVVTTGTPRQIRWVSQAIAKPIVARKIGCITMSAAIAQAARRAANANHRA
jgi:hypothetical protein